jgi:hypothetical protein
MKEVDTMYSMPTNEELKEFFLCGLRTGYSSKKEALRYSSSSGHAYDCIYCAGWHKVPETSNEAELIKQAKTKFDLHISRNQYTPHISNPPTVPMGVLTSSIIILGRE